VDYYYTAMANFEKMIRENSFVESAKFGGNRYGTSKMMIRRLTASGKVVVLDIEMEVGLFGFSCLLPLPAPLFSMFEPFFLPRATD